MKKKKKLADLFQVLELNYIVKNVKDGFGSSFPVTS
jgi:hypothetical protein